MEYIIISARERFSIGKGDQVVIKQLTDLLELKNINYRYIHISLSVKGLLSSTKTTRDSLKINVNFFDLIYAFYLIIFRRWPLQTAIFSNKKINKKIKKIFNVKEAIFILSQERTFGLKFQDSKIIYLFIDALAHNLKSRGNNISNPIKKCLVLFEAYRLEHFAKNNIPENARKVYVSAIDKLKYALPNSSVVPNYLPNILIRNNKIDDSSFTFVLSGNFDYQPNVDALNWFKSNHDLINSILDEKTSLYLVGMKSRKYEDHKNNIFASGRVEDIFSEIVKGSISIAPMVSGSGIQNKVLEALSLGVPCISSRIAFEPILEAYGAISLLHEFNNIEDFCNKVNEIRKNCLTHNKNLIEKELTDKLLLKNNFSKLIEGYDI